MVDMKIRNAKISDVDSIISLLKECEMFSDYLDTKEALSKKIKLDEESILVATEKNEIIGSIFILFDPWLPHIYRLCVRKNYRKRGIGTKLLGVAENSIRKRGYKIINLFVEEGHNEIIDFYKKRGWYEFVKCVNMEKRL